MLFFLTSIICLSVGIIAWFLIYWYEPTNIYGVPYRITLFEGISVGFLVCFVSFLVTVVFGPDMAKARAAEGYHQFYNGSVIAARIEVTECYRDGSCVHNYDCDPYQVAIHHPAQYDSKGNMTSPSYTTYETHYHSCPYATKELSYVLDDNIDRTIVIASHIFEESPQQWRSGRSIPTSVPREIPQRWLEAKQRLDAGNADPVTDVREYTNYILPADDQIIKQYSSDIERYQEQNLLPPHTENLDDVLYDYEMRANKLQFIGMDPIDNDLWQERLMAFNAALGSERQGDLHIVVLPSNAISNPDNYIIALTAFWQSNLGKWGFPKNGIAIAIGVDNTNRIAWARARTGMPEGNGEMLVAIQLNLPGVEFHPDIVLGQIRSEPYIREDGELKARYIHGSGILDDIMFNKFPFLRACMNCGDSEDNGTGYVYLKDSIPVSTGSKVWMIVISFFISLILWSIPIFLNSSKSDHF